MAQSKKELKKQLPKTIRDDIKQDNNHANMWLIQPTVLTMMRYDYTLMQSKIFLQVIDCLQGAIKKAFNAYKKNKSEDLEMSLFSNDEIINPENSDSIKLKIPIKKFGINPTQYNQLKEAFKSISSVPVEIEFTDKEGVDWQQFDNLCSVTIPKNSSGSNRTDYVYVDIKKRTAAYMLSMKSGYTKYLKQTVLLSTNSYTSRFYMLLSLYRTRKQSPLIRLSDLRQMLRLENKYPRFCDFKRRVIDVAYNDLKSMCERGVADFYFEWEKVYTTKSNKTGNPDIIKFTLHFTESSEISTTAKASLEAKRNMIYNILRGESVLLDEKRAVELSSRININNFETISYKLLNIIDQAKTKNHPRQYIYQSLTMEFNKIDSYPINFEEIEDPDIEEL